MIATMSTTFFLVRHAAHDIVDHVLVGRAAGVHLGARGKEQAERLGHRLTREDLSVLQSSPRERALETAEGIARACRMEIQIADPADEIDCGAWTGRTFESLQLDPAWNRWNSERGSARTAGGESMSEVQQRIIGHLSAEAGRHPGSRIAIVSHCDVIKAALLHCLGLSLDAIQRLQIDPASLSSLVLGAWGAKVLSVNERVTP
jgi:broad specificity phosphatase PhoE